MLVVFFTTILEMVHISNVIGKITENAGAGNVGSYPGEGGFLEIPDDLDDLPFD